MIKCKYRCPITTFIQRGIYTSMIPLIWSGVCIAMITLIWSGVCAAMISFILRYIQRHNLTNKPVWVGPNRPWVLGTLIHNGLMSRKREKIGLSHSFLSLHPQIIILKRFLFFICPSPTHWPKKNYS
jgi:hypothetical protein